MKLIKTLTRDCRALKNYLDCSPRTRALLRELIADRAGDEREARREQQQLDMVTLMVPKSRVITGVNHRQETEFLVWVEPRDGWGD